MHDEILCLHECKTCKYRDLAFYKDPCRSCVNNPRLDDHYEINEVG